MSFDLLDLSALLMLLAVYWVLLHCPLALQCLIPGFAPVVPFALPFFFWSTSLFCFFFSGGAGGASLIAQLVKNSPAMQETSVQLLGQKELLEKG